MYKKVIAIYIGRDIYNIETNDEYEFYHINSESRLKELLLLNREIYSIVVFIASVDKHEIYMTILIENPPDMIIVRNKLHLVYDKPNVTILNVIPWTGLSYNRLRKFTSYGNSPHKLYKIYLVSDKSKQLNVFFTTRSIIKHWWIYYFIDTYTNCGTGSILQVSGTCSINAVINGLFFNKTMKFKILDRFITRLHKHPRQVQEITGSHIHTSYANIITSDINVYPFEDEDKHFLPLDIYIFKLFYHSVIGTDFISNIDIDIGKILTSYISLKNVGKVKYIKYIIMSLLDKLKIEYNVITYINNTLKFATLPPNVLPIEAMRSKQETTFIYSDPVDPVKDILLYIDAIELDQKQILYIGDYTYSLEYIQFGIKHDYEHGHALIGFKCDDNIFPYRIFDPNIGIFYHINWTTDTFMDEINKLYRSSKLYFSSISYAVYIKI